MQSKQNMTDFVINLLKDKLPEFYYYHNFKHTLYVVDKALEIGKNENCSDKDLDLLTTAALWHDTGYVNTYSNHEEEGCLLARKYLPRFGYGENDIEKVCGMIMATKIPQSPKNKLERILADADLEYLGTDKFEETAYDLFREFQQIDHTLTEQRWNEIQIEFLQNHHYFTSFCQENREPKKQEYLNKMG